MYGAIIGDLAGSIYEYEQTRTIKEIHLEKIILLIKFIVKWIGLYSMIIGR